MAGNGSGREQDTVWEQPSTAPQTASGANTCCRALMGGFRFGQRLSVIRDIPNDRCLLQDATAATVATLPRFGFGEIVTHSGCWHSGIERIGHGWAVVMRQPGSPGSAVTVRPDWRPDGYRLDATPDLRFRLLRGWLNGDWRLSDGRTRLATLTLGSQFGAAYDENWFSHPRQEVGAIVMHEGTIASAPLLGLLIVSALETVKADREIPVTRRPL
jgi:hypothetical protein